MEFQIPAWWNWKATYALVLAVLLSALCYFFFPFPAGSPAIAASVLWGIVTLTFCLIFMLGAAQTPMQFLVFFGMGAFGAGMGYLVGAWLTPSGESNPLDQARNIVAGVLTGVVGTKLLTLWDDLVDRPPGGGPPPIMTAPYFVPVVIWLVGFTVSLSAFYTVRTEQSGDVRITYSPRSAVHQLSDAQHVGILPETTVQFAGAANSPADVTVTWDFRLEQPCGVPVAGAKLGSAQFKKETVEAFDTATGKLNTPSKEVMQEWFSSCPGSQNWILTATSNQDRSKISQFNIKFCRTTQDCPVVSGMSSLTAALPAGGTSATAPTSQPNAAVGAAGTATMGGKEETKANSGSNPAPAKTKTGK